MINYIEFWLARRVADLIAFWGAIGLILLTFSLIYAALAIRDWWKK